jgi:hypothetical protein
MRNPFLTIVFRCTNRPAGIRRALEALRAQSDQDYQLLCLIDDKGRGIPWANKNLKYTKQHVKGEYVYMYEDDDQLQYVDFVKDLKRIVSDTQADVVMCKALIWDKVFPTALVWQNKPIISQIGTPCFAVSNKVYQRHVHAEDVQKCGDFHFISDVWTKGYRTYWWNEVVNSSNHLRGKTESLDQPLNSIFDEFNVPEEDRIWGTDHIVFDLDDFYEDNHLLPVLRELYEATPGFKVNLFTVVGRCSRDWIEGMKGLAEWADLIPHGWTHETNFECSEWSKDDGLRYLDKLEIYGLTKGFKSPGWQTSPGMYQALKERGYWIAEHHANKSKVPEGLRMYLLDGTERIHGHIQNVCGNGLIEKLTTYQSLQGNFRFIREII